MTTKLKQALHVSDKQLTLPEPVPSFYYSNEVVPNKLFMLMARVQALLFCHLAQTPIQSKITQRARSLYHQFANQKQVGRLDERRAANHLKELSWPKRSNRGIISVLMFEFALVIRSFLTLMMLFDVAARMVKVTVSKDLDTVDKKLYELDPMPVERVLVLNGSTNLGLAEVQRQECLEILVGFIGQRYGKFLFWNASIGWEKYPILNNFFFMEQSKPVQMFREETLLFMYITGSLIIFCGITGSLVTFYLPYDVIPLLFVYDPTYCAFQVKTRLKHYLNEARQSYLNYWSTFKLNPDFSLSACGSSNETSLMEPPRCDSGGGKWAGVVRGDSYLTSGQRVSFIVYPRNASLAHNQTISRKLHTSIQEHSSTSSTIGAPVGRDSNDRRPMNVKTRSSKTGSQVLSLRDDQYQGFIPDARSQAFRWLFLAVVAPVAGSCAIALSLSLVFVYVYFNGLNEGTIKLNQEFQLLFETTNNWAALQNSTSIEKCFKSDDNSEQQPIELVRFSLVNYLAQQLDRLTNSTTWRNPNAITGYGLAQQVAESIQPTRNPSFYEWTLPACASVLTGTLSVLYLTIFFICIGDLCFWLFSLRVKLNVCHLVLRYYSDTLSLGQHGKLDTKIIQRGTAESNRSPATTHERGRHTRYGFGQSIEQQTYQIDDILQGPSLHSENNMEREKQNDLKVPESMLHINNDTTPANNLNLGVWNVFRWALVSNKERETICCQFAKKLILADCSFRDERRTSSTPTAITRRRPGRRADGNKFSSPTSSTTISSSLRYNNLQYLEQRTSDVFLMSAYLEFRLFLEQIDACRQSVNVITAYGTIHSINILVSSMFTKHMRSKIAFLLVGYILVNMCLISASFFQSQCTKIMQPIYSILANSLKSNKAIKHLAILWQRSLIDLLGARSRFCFKVLSVRISYASALQFNFGITSLYLLTVDRFRNI